MIHCKKITMFPLILTIFALFIIIGGRAHAEEFNIKTSTNNWIFPAKGEISDIFDSREGEHKGIDIAGIYNSPVYAADQGVVVKSYYSQSYGNVIFVHHSNGFETVYAHLARRLVQEGDRVQKGETVGTMGNTGESTGTHLHFEVHEGEWTLDKRNAINPFIVYGNGEIGQLVFALQHDPYGIKEVANPVSIPSIHTEVLKQFYKVEELSNGLNELYAQQTYVAIKKVKTGTDNTYIVKKGDTLISISEKLNIPLSTIIKLNHISNKDLIYPKQEIKIIEEQTKILNNHIIFK